MPAFGAIVGVLFDVMFAALGVMLVFSTGLILYSSLFNAAETAFLLSTPARADQVFGHKYRGAWASAAGASCSWARRSCSPSVPSTR